MTSDLHIWQADSSSLRRSISKIKVRSQSNVRVNKVKVNVAHTRLPSVGFRSWSRFLAVSLQVTWVINPAVGCHYFPPGLQLPPQALRGLLPILLLGEQRHNGWNSLPQTTTRQRRDCDLNPGPSASESSTLTTRLPSQRQGNERKILKVDDTTSIEGLLLQRAFSW